MHAQQRMLAAILLALTATALHWPPGEAEFTLDDRDFVLENMSIRSADTALDATLRSFPPAQHGRALYRPLTNLSHALEWPWFGDEAAGYVAVNAALYAGVALALFALLAQYEIGLGAAFGATLLFVTHPVHSEAVDPAAGRSELLALGLSLLCLLVFTRSLYEPGSRTPRARPAPGLQALALLAFAGAALSKETGLVTGGLLALLRLMALRRSDASNPWGRAALDLAPFALLGAGVLLLRFLVLGRLSPDPSTYDFAFDGAWQRAATLGAISLEYARLLVWPDVLQIDFYYERRVGVQQAFGPRVVAGWTLLAASAVALAAAARRWWTTAPNPGSPLAAGILGGAMFGLYLLPVSHVVDIGALMAERFLFAPSAGLALVAAALLTRTARTAPGWRALVAAAVLVAAVAGGWRSVQRAAEWRNPQALWSSVAQALPEDERAWTALAAIAGQHGDFDAAAAALERGRAIDPTDYSVRLTEANLALARGELREAERLYREMIASGGVDHRVWLNLAVIAARDYHHSAAQADLERALAIQPNYAPTHALQERIAADLVRFRGYLDRHRGALETSQDPDQLASIATACRALGDRRCERAARRRARALRQGSARAERPPAASPAGP